MNKCNHCFSEIKKNKKYCNKSCAAKHNNIQYPKRTNGRKRPKCIGCNKEIIGRYNRKYCSNDCQGKLKQKNKLIEISSIIEKNNYNLLGKNSTIDRLSKRYLIEKHGEKCMNCGWNTINNWTKRVPIELNHIDGNPENHDIYNLELLCPNCHSLTEFHKSRGKGRKWRKK